MKIMLNHAAREVADGTSVAEILAQAGFPTKGIAVAMKGHLVKRTEWETTIPEEGADLIVIHAVCGG